MARVATEQAERQLEEVSVIFHAWYGNRDSDSVAIQKMRVGELALGSRLLHDLTYSVRPEQGIVLEVGDEPLRASRFNKGAYDFYTESPVTLEPGSHLTFWRAEPIQSRDGQEMYFGDYSVLLSSTGLARALFERGSLRLQAADMATD